MSITFLKSYENINYKGMSFEVLGVLVAAIIQGIMISLYNKKVPCEESLNLNTTNDFSAFYGTNSSSMSSLIPNYSKFVSV